MKAECPFCKSEMPDQAVGLSACRACMNPVEIDPNGKGTVPKGAQDIRQIAPPGSIGGEVLKALPQALEDLPILPEISQRIMQMLNDPDLSMRSLASLINQDQVIAMRVLKLANSAVYGGLQEIKDLNGACARLGTRTIANAVQAAANGNLYITGNEAFRDHMKQLWRHAVATAHCASEIADVLAEPRADVLFVAGLIHDIGRVVLLDIIANQYRGILADLRSRPDLLEEVFNGYAPLAGLHAVLKWELPPEYRSTTYYLRTPEKTSEESIRSLVHVVALAEAVAVVSGFGLGMQVTSLTSIPSARALGMSDLKLATVRANLDEKLAPLIEMGGVA
ncbi:MAG TPA: HDOD domain-containing protein [Candidatus Hydrogenedentes bacterium]|nr:HDOD domain-containing protein [Candidatus Hydrogenedentota bacterium]